MTARIFPHVVQHAMVLAAFLGGCASSPPAQPSAAATLRVEPSSKLSLEAFFAAGSALEVVSATGGCQRDIPIFIDIIASVTEARPGLLVQRGGSWTVLSFDNDELSQHGWVGVSAASDCRQLAAVADLRVESPGWELAFLLSQDGGQSFRRVGTLKKPYYLAQVRAFTLDEHGAGELTVALDDDYGAGVTPGIYRYETSDFGATWSVPHMGPLTSLSEPPPSPIKIGSQAELERFSGNGQ